MNIASDVYHAVIRPFQSQQSRSGVTNQQSGELEREEDGFLLVAETESEKTTVYASNFTGDSPPDYNQAQVYHTDQRDGNETFSVQVIFICPSNDRTIMLQYCLSVMLCLVHSFNISKRKVILCRNVLCGMPVS